MGHRSNGFTLTELVIVIAIVGILSVVAVEHSVSSVDATLQTQAMRMAAEIRRAQNLAINSSQRVCFRTRVLDGVYGYYVSKYVGSACLSEAAAYSRADLAKGVVIEQGSVDLIFSGIGVPNAAAAFTLDGSAAKAGITVAAVTGRVSLQ